MGDAEDSSRTYSWHVINYTRYGIMKAAARNVLIVITAAVIGLLLAMNLPQSPSVDNGVAPEGIAANVAGANNASDLVSSVDWSKIKQEPMSPTF
jgi:hypothetical protein